MSEDTGLSVVPREAHTLTAADIRVQVNLIQAVMRAVMKEGTHYGKVPGTSKKSLWKPGAEVILSTFRIAVDPRVEDLSTPDAARYRVTAVATHQTTGLPLGSALGECSSDEEKYRWRAVICEEDWEATPENRRRLKWKRGDQKAYSIRQVRAEPADIANTILKMAAKRAEVAVTLRVTAASDCFTQDIEDLPEEIQHEIARENGAVTPVVQPQRKSAAARENGAVTPVVQPQRKSAAAPPPPAPAPVAVPPLADGIFDEEAADSLEPGGLVVQSKEEKHRAGKASYWIIYTSDDQKIATFDKTLADKLTPGVIFKPTSQRQGQYGPILDAADVVGA